MDPWAKWDVNVSCNCTHEHYMCPNGRIELFISLSAKIEYHFSVTMSNIEIVYASDTFLITFDVIARTENV